MSKKASFCGGYHIVSRQGPPDPLEHKLTHRLDLHSSLDLHQHSRADEDLTRLCLIAQPRGDVGYRPDGGVVEASLEADGAERREPVRYANTEANVVSQATPRFGQRSNGVTHFKRHEHRLKRRVLYWHWIIKDHHHAVPGVPFERAVVLDE